MMCKITYRSNILLLHGNYEIYWFIYTMFPLHGMFHVIPTCLHIPLIYVHILRFAWSYQFCAYWIEAAPGLRLENLKAEESVGENQEVTFKKFVEGYPKGLTFWIIEDLPGS